MTKSLEKYFYPYDSKDIIVPTEGDVKLHKEWLSWKKALNNLTKDEKRRLINLGLLC